MFLLFMMSSETLSSDYRYEVHLITRIGNPSNWEAGGKTKPPGLLYFTNVRMKLVRERVSEIMISHMAADTCVCKGTRRISRVLEEDGVEKIHLELNNFILEKSDDSLGRSREYLETSEIVPEARDSISSPE